MEMDKNFSPAESEKEIFEKWEKSGAFRAGANAKVGAKSFCIMIPPPNVTGSLHMGHAFNNTLQDILIRWHRMRGFDTLWQPGQDHAGIATQMVVERQLAENGEPSRSELGRDKFLKKIWEWKAQSGGKISEQYAEKASKHTIIIDNSSFFRMDPAVPLIVPQVNSKDIKNMKKNIIANPNCSTAQLVIALKPLHDLFKIERVIVSTYQSVSGGGKAPMNELIEQTKLSLESKNIDPKNFTKQIAFNAIPHIDVFTNDGYTKEELKMVNETKKILDKKIELSATCVRIPVLVSHAESVNIQFEKPFSLKKVRIALDNFEGCKVIDERVDGGYATPLDAEGRNETFISRS